MDLKCYLAMTATEFLAADPLPENPAWMACHFSCYGTGLSNLPTFLPEGAMLIVNDRTPPHCHDPAHIARQLHRLTDQFRVACILLDLQRPDTVENFQISKEIVQSLPCPVGVSSYYARDLDCPVFLSSPPPHRSLQEHFSVWTGREIWLEAATETQTVTVTKEGSCFSSANNVSLENPTFTDMELHCRYHTQIYEDSAIFTLQRDLQSLVSMLQDAQTLGVTRAVGLFQQLGNNFPNITENQQTAGK